MLWIIVFLKEVVDFQAKLKKKETSKLSQSKSIYPQSWSHWYVSNFLLQIMWTLPGPWYYHLHNSLSSGCIDPCVLHQTLECRICLHSSNLLSFAYPRNCWQTSAAFIHCRWAIDEQYVDQHLAGVIKQSRSINHSNNPHVAVRFRMMMSLPGFFTISWLSNFLHMCCTALIEHDYFQTILFRRKRPFTPSS